MGVIEQALEKATDTKAQKIGIGAMAGTAEMFKNLFPGQKAVVVADTNTFRVAGREVDAILRSGGIVVEEPFVFDDPDLFAEWHFLEQLEARVRELGAVPVAVGSGVINDLTKLCCEHLGLRYIIVGTAASMDGYTAYGASVSYKGNKQTFDCKAPLGIVFDPQIAADAPKDLAASGYADLIAKIPAGADWMIADSLGVDKIDDFAFGLVQNNLRKALSDPDAVVKGDVAATEGLAEGLIMSGFAMQAIQSSRPASGAEHQYSHCWDMENLCIDGRHVSHGFKVGIGTLVSTACLEYLLNYDFSKLNVDACVERWPEWEDMEKTIKCTFEGKPGLVSRCLTESRGKYIGRDGLRKQIELFLASWPVLKEKIRAQIIPFEDVRDRLKRVGSPYEPEMINVTREHLRDTFRVIPYMRSRFTNADIIHRFGLMDEVEAYLFGNNGFWPL